MTLRPIGRVVVVVFLMGLAAALSGAQRPNQPPPRDSAAAPPQTGAAAISGRVVEADTGRPLRRSRATLTGPGLPRQGLVTSTDEAGRYEFSRLPAGRFTLTAQRSGYLQLRYGQRRPGEQGKPLDVGDGETLERIDFALPRAAVISGRVIDELGEPIAGVLVSAQRYIYSQEQRRLMPDGPITTTDDAGEYRIVGLMPGSYMINARTFDKWTAPIGGRDEVMGYEPTFFPGVTEPGEASRLSVATGQELGNIDFALVPGRTARISGIALDSKGQPIRNVVLSYEVVGSAGGRTGISGQATVGPDGGFEISNVSPGEYRLGGVGTQEAAATPIVVVGADLSNIVLGTSAGWSLRGQVVIDSAKPASLRRTDVTIAANPIFGRVFMGGGPEARQVINDDWTFVVTGVLGPARLRVTLPDGWAVKAVLQSDRDVADARFDLAGGEELAGLQVVVTDRAATLTGQLTDAKGGAADGTVLLFPADANRWFDGSRFVRVARPDQQGRYRIPAILPGQYLAAALDYVEQGTWNDPEYLESVRRHAQSVTFEGTEARELTLRVVMP